MMDRTKKPEQPATPTATLENHSLAGSTLAFKTELPSAEALVEGNTSPKKFAADVADALRMNPARLGDVRNSLLTHPEPGVVSATLYGVAQFDKHLAIEEARKVIMRGNDASPGAFVVLNQLTMTDQDKEKGRLSLMANSTLNTLQKSDAAHLSQLGNNLRMAWA